MTPTAFILILNPVMAAIFAVSLFVLWYHQKRLTYILPLCVAFVLKMLGYLLQLVTLTDVLAVPRFVSNCCFMAAAVLFVGGLVARFGAQPPYRMLVGIAGVTIAIFSWFLFVEPSYEARVVVLNAGLALIASTGALVLRPLARGNFVERMQVYLLALSGAAAITRCVPLLLPGAAPIRSIDSPYWLGVTGSDVVLSTLLVLSIFAGVALDVFDKLRSESSRDVLSGLLNRRGFEDRVDAIRPAGGSRRVACALILADLDHFKRVNDTFGHAMGDRVIVAFAHALRDAAGANGLVARLGGEEFVVLLPSANAAVATLVAARVKAVFAKGHLPGLPAENRPTASFGIAEIASGEPLDTALHRADGALYRAKHEGRDCVRLAAGEPSDPDAPTARREARG